MVRELSVVFQIHSDFQLVQPQKWACRHVDERDCAARNGPGCTKQATGYYLEGNGQRRRDVLLVDHFEAQSRERSCAVIRRVNLADDGN